MTRLVVPLELNRNASRVTAAGHERTGNMLIDLVLQKLGWPDLSQADVLDVGCGVRFVQTILNLGIPIRSYTGVDVHRPLIEFLTHEVHDPRFFLSHWDVHNAMYNPHATARMTRESSLPVTGSYDLIWLFSVFTHLAPEDADAMLAILRRYVRPKGRLFFTTFIGADVDEFEDRDAPAHPLNRAFYGEAHLRGLVERNGWKMLSSDPRDPERFIQHHFLCRPC
jgi:SAM-dependent methyltransferase